MRPLFLPPSRPVQVRCCAVSSVTRGGRARARRGTSRKSGRLPRTTRTRMYVRTWVFMAETRRSTPPPFAGGRPTWARSRGEVAQTSWATSREAGSARSEPAHARPQARTHAGAEVEWGWWISALCTRRRKARERRAHVAAELVVVVQRGAPRCTCEKAPTPLPCTSAR